MKFAKESNCKRLSIHKWSRQFIVSYDYMNLAIGMVLKGSLFFTGTLQPENFAHKPSLSHS